MRRVSLTSILCFAYLVALVMSLRAFSSGSREEFRLRGSADPFSRLAKHSAQHSVALLLGGPRAREISAVQILSDDPVLLSTIDAAILSSGSSTLEQLRRDAPCLQSILEVDNRAVDTVSNFTTLVHRFRRRRTEDVLVLTSKYHMDRAMAIGRIVLGRFSIQVTGKATEEDTDIEKEPTWKLNRDVFRSFLYIYTGIDLSFVTRILKFFHFL